MEEETDVTAVRWECYPSVASDDVARSWLDLQAHLQLAPKTIDAYGRCLNDYLIFCAKRSVAPETGTREHIAWYVHDLATRPHPHGASIVEFRSHVGLANATMQQRITVVRLYYDYLIEQQRRQDNPVGRGHYVPGKAFGGMRDRALIPHYEKLPWIPSDEEWRRILGTLKTLSLRNQVMFLVAYDGALRRQEVVTISINDIDFAYRQIRIRAEHAKNGAERIVSYGTLTGRLLEHYLIERRQLSLDRGALFLSESRRNRAQPLSLGMWSKVIEQLAECSQVPRLTTHTMRHLRLTHLARAKLDLHQIALYAGHRSLQTTMRYIHLSGVELTEAVMRSLAGFDRWIEQAFVGEA